jgi:hypothetical protein
LVAAFFCLSALPVCFIELLLHHRCRPSERNHEQTPLRLFRLYL